jgi:hypothetical protein
MIVVVIVIVIVIVVVAASAATARAAARDYAGDDCMGRYKHVRIAEGVGIDGQAAEGNGEAVSRAVQVGGLVREQPDLRIAAAVDWQQGLVVTDPGVGFIQLSVANQQVVQQDSVSVDGDADGANFSGLACVQDGALGSVRSLSQCRRTSEQGADQRKCSQSGVQQFHFPSLVVANTSFRIAFDRRYKPMACTLLDRLNAF